MPQTLRSTLKALFININWEVEDCYLSVGGDYCYYYYCCYYYDHHHYYYYYYYYYY